MQAGKLRHKIAIQAETQTINENGYPVSVWTTVKTVWADVVMSGGREFYAAQRLNAETSAVFRVRYDSGVTTKHRIVHDAKTYDILAVIDPDGRRSETQIYAKEVV
jgi:SPP1 family predicted phage head-tail adaptor